MTDKNYTQYLNIIMKTVNETVQDVENKGTELTGVQKLSMAIEFIIKILNATGVIKSFPEFTIKLIKILPDLINFSVKVFNEFGVFKHA